MRAGRVRVHEAIMFAHDLHEPFEGVDDTLPIADIGEDVH